LRGTSFALEELAARATGVSGPLARIGEQFLLLGVGGAWGLAILGGLAAAGLAYKELTKDSDAAAVSTEKWRKEIEKLVEAAKPASQRLAETLGINQAGAGNPEALSAARAELARLQHVESMGLGGPGIAGRIQNAERDVANLDNQLRRARGPVGMLAPVVVEQDPAITHAWDFDEPFSTAAYRFQRGVTRFGASGTAGLDRLGRGSIAAGGEELGDRARKLLESLPTEHFAGQLKLLTDAFNLGQISAKEYKDGIDEIHKKMREMKTTADDIKSIGTAAVHLLGTHDVGGAVSAAGGLASAASKLHGLSALGPVGAGLDVAGSLLSLFASGQAKVTITNFEEQAIAKLKEVRGEALTTSFTIIAPTADIRSALYALQRAGARGVTTRQP
jgi:hypothetical protein